MKFLLNVSILIFFIVQSRGLYSMSMKKEIYKIGYFANNFPQDPLTIRSAREHSVIAQVIDPLVDHDSEGNIIPSIAKFWKVSNNSKTFTFTLDDSKYFSTGRKVESDDVVYSLNRHLTSKESQSFQYLQNIKSIKSLNKTTVVIDLFESQVSILKILSRSHLGILPSGWIFNPKNDEAIIGTGAYRLIRKKSLYFLKIRDEAKKKGKLGSQIPIWQLVFKSKKPEGVPDYMPITDAMELKRVKSSSEFNKSKYKVKKEFTLAQTAVWWHPKGVFFKDKNKQKFIVGVVRELIALSRKNLSYDATTGIIPKGIAGHLTNPPIFKSPSKHTGKTPFNIRIALLNREYKEIFSHQKIVEEVEHKFNVKFITSLFTYAKIKDIGKQKPDLLVYSWMGGFADPEGFIPVITSALEYDLYKYLGIELADIYKRGTVEPLWKKRSELFKTLNEKLILNNLVIPAWHFSVFSILNTKMNRKSVIFKYYYDLTDISYATKLAK